MTKCLFDEKQADFLNEAARGTHYDLVRLTRAVHAQGEQIETLTGVIRALQEQLKPKSRVQGTPKARHEYDPAFEQVWLLYPKRAGSNSKFKAEQAWKKRIKETSVQPDIEQGVMRYRKFCEATGKVGTEFVLQAATFFGPAKHYLEDWELPKPEKRKMTQDELVKHYTQEGKPPRPGETTEQWLRRVQG